MSNKTRKAFNPEPLRWRPAAGYMVGPDGNSIRLIDKEPSKRARRIQDRRRRTEAN